MSYGHNKYAAWSGNVLIDQDPDYGVLVTRVSAVLDQYETVTLVEYAPPSMKVVGKVVLK